MQSAETHPPLPPTGGLNARFGDALFDPDLPIPPGVTGPRGKKAIKRFSVYRNNVTFSIVNALGDIFPAIRKLIGETGFADVARIFIRQHPPASPLLFEYGRDFAAFLEEFGPLSRYAYLPDIARLERAWLDAFHAADATPLSHQTLASIAPENLGNLVFKPHPAARIIESRYAVLSITSKTRADEPLDGIKPANPESVLVTRPATRVDMRLLPPGGASFIASLLAGNSLGEAAAQAANETQDFDLSGAIGLMIEAGIFTELAVRQS